MVFKCQMEGFVVCIFCGKFVVVNDEKCWYCGWCNFGFWGYVVVFCVFGDDFGFMCIVVGVCFFFYVLMLVVFLDQILNCGFFSFLVLGSLVVEFFGVSGYFLIFGGGCFWMVFSVGLLYGGLIYIGFNFYWFN